jgi:hypothetical protein
MATPIDQIKDRLTIVDLVAETYTVTGRGRTRTTTEHDSLILWPATNTWHWFSRGIGGDIFDWVQHTHRIDFAEALRRLADKAGVELRPLTPQEEQARHHQRAHHQILAIAADHHHRILTEHPAADRARAYCADRGWTEDTIRRERIGYVLPQSPITNHQSQSPADNNALSTDGTSADTPSPEWRDLAAQLRQADLLDHPTAKLVLSLPQDMIVYVHQIGGRVHYLSGRSVEGKRHYNLPADKSTYTNNPAHHDTLHAREEGRGGIHLLVEGQADAISLSQFGIEATAFCALDATDGVIPSGITHIALDNDKPGTRKAAALAISLNPLAGVITWPESARHNQDEHGYLTIKDAGDLTKTAITTADITKLINSAPTALEVTARATKDHTGDLRTEAQRHVLDAYLSLDELVQADIKPQLARALDVGVQQLNRMIKAREKEREAEAADDPQESAARDEYSAGGWIGGHLVEQFVEWNSAGIPTAYYYIRLPDGTLDRRASINIGGIQYMPINPMDDENISKGTVLFPSGIEEYGSETALLADIRAFLHKWFDMEPFWERIVSYYILFTWFYDAGFETIPYLRALGDYGTGKTRFIESAGFLCYRPMMISGGDSDSVIFRMIDTYHGTMIVDEADFGDSAANALIAKIINMGNRQLGNIKRLDGDNDYKVKVFKVFCPKVFAARYEFGDDALGSRCITKFMTKSDPRRDVPRDTDPSFRTAAQIIRNKLAHYRLKTWRPVEIDHTLTDYTIMARLSQITLALRTIIKDPEALAELDTYIKLYNQSLIGERRMTDQAIIVHALARIYHGLDQPNTMIKVQPDFTLKHIAEVAQELMAELDPERKLTSKSISPIIRNQLGITARGRDNSRGGGGAATIIVNEQDLAQLMARYGITLDTETDTA